jgi:hypothetical protein
MHNIINRFRAYTQSLDAQMMAELEANNHRLTSNVAATRFATLLFLPIAIITVCTVQQPSLKTHQSQPTTVQK